jgi:hypothetical protein
VSDPNYPVPPQQPYYTPQAPPPSGGSKLVPVLLGAVIALIAANVYLFFQIDTVKQDQAKIKEAFASEITQVKETSNVSQAAAKRNMESLQEELEAARRQASMAVGQAKVDAEKHVSEVARRLEVSQKQSEQRLTQEVSKVGEVASSATQKAEAVGTEVTTVKTDVEKTKSELQATINQLKSTQGDMGVQSGLIATNSKELAALRALGERNYFEFRLGKTKEPQRVGDVMLQLSKSDQKKNRYTVMLTFDDKRVEKKDKGLNEPVQFYTSKARQPYEIVVNEVGKDLIAGYLATPKVQSSR